MVSKKAEDVKLASITRALDEDIPLIKTVGRLPRQITSKDLTLTLEKHIIKEGKGFIKEDPVLLWIYRISPRSTRKNKKALLQYEMVLPARSKVAGLS